MRLPVVFGTLLFLANTVAAAPTDKDGLYDIEVLVFENRNTPASDVSAFEGKNAVTLPGLADAVVPTTPATGGYKLAGSAAQLEKDGQYRVLFHQRWSQTVDTKGGVKARRITGGTELDGLVKVYLSRYLHADVQLVLKDTAVTGGVVHRIDEQRRVKSQEVHYYDHPRFGVLLTVNAPEKERGGR
ncbi:MAG: hypothetical protein HY942_02485 [Gammaproteobacteria bacterium]|nr:hypothetical protein [Gammaproteobacteria bacterium]